MKIRICTLFSSLAASVFMALNAPSADAAAYIKYDGVDGESIDTAHQNWSDIVKLTYNLKREPSSSGGPAVLVFGDIVCTKELDKSSPKIAEALLNGEIIDKATIEVTKTVEGVEVVYLQIELINVSIKTNKVTIDTDLGEEAGEEQSFSYEQIGVVYTPFDSRGRPQEAVKYSWNVIDGAGGGE